MSGKNIDKIPARKALFGLIIPIGVCIATLFFNLKPIFQQSLVGIMFIWLYIGLMSGFGVWS